MTLALFRDRALTVSPVLLGVFASAFWTSIALTFSRRADLGRVYQLMAWYAVGATIFNATRARFYGTSIAEPSAYMTALFAGAALAIWIVSPVRRAIAPRHAVFLPAGAAMIIGIPVLLLPPIFFANHAAVGTFLLFSAVFGLTSVAFFINAGFSGGRVLPAVVALIPQALILTLVRQWT